MSDSGMQLDPSNCVLPANRAMALLKKSQYGAAEADCTLALSIDPTYVEVYSIHIASDSLLLGLTFEDFFVKPPLTIVP